MAYPMHPSQAEQEHSPAKPAQLHFKLLDGHHINMNKHETKEVEFVSKRNPKHKTVVQLHG